MRAPRLIKTLLRARPYHDGDACPRCSPCAFRSITAAWHVPPARLLHPCLLLVIYSAVLLHRAPTTYGPHFLRSNPAPPPRASPLTSPLYAELSILLRTALHASPCPALPAPNTPPHACRVVHVRAVPPLRNRGPPGLSLHGTRLWFSLDSHPTVSSFSQSFAHTLIYTPLPVSFAHSPLFRSSRLSPPRSIYSRPPFLHHPVPLPSL